MFFTDGS